MKQKALKQKKLRGGRGYRLAPYLFSAPYVITYCVFTLFPMLFTLFLSFTDWDGYGEIKLVGFQNYQRMFDITADPRFFQTLLNTGIIVLLTMPIGIFLGLFLCYFMQKRAIRGQHVFRVLYYLPALMTAVAVGLLWSTLFDYENGTFNKILQALHLTKENIYFMGTGWGCRLVLALLVIWSSFGSTMLFLSSALRSINEEVLDAALVDGAGPWKTYWKISVPMIKQVMIFIVITGLINAFQMYDASVMLFSSGPSGGLPYGGVDRSCLTMVMLIMEEAFENMHYGYAAALSYGMFLCVGVFSFFSMKMMTREKER
ncbi:MAG: sugar ABC transporter permease [Oscillospiraceae bacterium]|nr:sugar ABC transporter permease [Oscillospiraceae bacterium]